MPFSAFDLLDDDPLGLFGDNKPKKKRIKRRTQHEKSIYEGLDEFKENEEKTESINFNRLNSFMKNPLKPLSKSVTFNDEEIHIQITPRQEDSNSNELDGDMQKIETSLQLSEDEAINASNATCRRTSPLGELDTTETNLIEDKTLASLSKTETDEQINADSLNVSNDFIKGELNTNNNPACTKSAGDSHLLLSKSKSPCNSQYPLEPNNCSMDNENAPFFEECEDFQNEAVFSNRELKNNNTAPQQSSLSLNTYNDVGMFDGQQKLEYAKEKNSPPHSRQNSPDSNSATPPSKPTPRRIRMKVGAKVEAQINDTSVDAIIYNHRTSSEHQPDESPRDIVIGPLRKVTTNTVIRRPRSCHSIGRQRTSTPETPDLGEETNAAALRMMAYKNWYQRHLKSAQQHRVNSLKQDALETRKQREDLERTKSNEQAFEAWRAKKRAFFRDQLRQKRAQEEQRQKEMNEATARKASSTKAFEVWKSRKDGEIRKQYREGLNKEKSIEQTKAQMEAEKRAQSERAFAAWKAQKEAKIRETLHNERLKQSEEEKKREEEARLKSEKAAEAYYQWELRKLSCMDFGRNGISGLNRKKVSSVDNLRPSVSRESIAERFPWRPPSTRPTVMH